MGVKLTYRRTRTRKDGNAKYKIVTGSHTYVYRNENGELVRRDVKFRKVEKNEESGEGEEKIEDEDENED